MQNQMIERGRRMCSFFRSPTTKKIQKCVRNGWNCCGGMKNISSQISNKKFVHFTSLHFVDGCPTKEHPYPELFAYNNVSQMTTQYGTSIPLGLRSCGTFMKLQTARSTATSTTIEDLTLDTDIQHLGIYSRWHCQVIVPDVAVSQLAKI